MVCQMSVMSGWFAEACRLSCLGPGPEAAAFLRQGNYSLASGHDHLWEPKGSLTIGLLIDQQVL